MFIWKMLYIYRNMYYVYLENVIHLEKYVFCLFVKCYTFREICIMFIWKMLYI